MYHTVSLYFQEDQTVRFKVLADTPTGALITVLAFDWTIAQRQSFIGSRVSPYTAGSVS